jgi:hypothetical protein
MPQLRGNEPILGLNTNTEFTWPNSPWGKSGATCWSSPNL